MWREIEYFNNYEVSTDGKVRNKKTRRVLKPIDNGQGYLQVDLYVNGKGTSKRINRLVAEAFIPNPEKLPQVNHINEIKADNRVDNLNWMTAKENANHGTRTERMKNNHEWKKKHAEQLQRLCESNSMPIIVIYRDNTYEEYPSAKIAAQELELNKGHICDVLKGRRKTTGDLRFEYAEESE